jgi:ppGpp synthetase/RelA/SpoT-type nucleotidyltranferase
MIVSPMVQRQFENKYDFIKLLHDTVREILFNYCSSNGFAFTDRIKSLESLSEKIETGRYKRWSDIDDLYACTIIIPNLNIEKEVLSFLNLKFKRVLLKNRGEALKSPDVFRFDNTRFIGNLKQSGYQSEISKINFEIQIKTAFEHAWSVSTHSLVYKANEIDWKLLRIAAQLKSSVEQLDMIVSGAKQLNLHITEHNWPEIEIKKFILSNTNEFLKNANVPEELKPKDSSRFSDNLYSFFLPIVKDSNKAKKKLIPYFKKANEIANLLGISKFPRSISLIQYFIGVAYEFDFEFEHDKYTPLITLEMETIFPKIKTISKRFELK